LSILIQTHDKFNNKNNVYAMLNLIFFPGDIVPFLVLLICWLNYQWFANVKLSMVRFCLIVSSSFQVTLSYIILYYINLYNCSASLLSEYQINYTYILYLQCMRDELFVYYDNLLRENAMN